MASSPCTIETPPCDRSQAACSFRYLLTEIPPLTGSRVTPFGCYSFYGSDSLPSNGAGGSEKVPNLYPGPHQVSSCSCSYCTTPPQLRIECTSSNCSSSVSVSQKVSAYPATSSCTGPPYRSCTNLATAITVLRGAGRRPPVGSGSCTTTA